MLEFFILLKDYEHPKLTGLLDECSQILSLSSQQFEVSRQSIYFYQYMALQMQMPLKYADSMLRFVSAGLNEFIPFLWLGSQQQLKE